MNCSPVPRRRSRNLSSVSFPAVLAVPGSPSHCGSQFSDQGLKEEVKRRRSVTPEEPLSPRRETDQNFGKVDKTYQWKLPRRLRRSHETNRVDSWGGDFRKCQVPGEEEGRSSLDGGSNRRSLRWPGQLSWEGGWGLGGGATLDFIPSPSAVCGVSLVTISKQSSISRKRLQDTHSILRAPPAFLPPSSLSCVPPSSPGLLITVKPFWIPVILISSAEGSIPFHSSLLVFSLWGRSVSRHLLRRTAIKQAFLPSILTHPTFVSSLQRIN